MCSKVLTVHLSGHGQHLIDLLSVYYGKVYTVEGNWKAKDIGYLDCDSIKPLLHYWRKVFGFVMVNLPESGMSPFSEGAKEAILSHVGATMESLAAVPGYGAYLSPLAT